MRIETALAKGSMTRVERRDPKATYHRMSRQELQALSPAFPWDRYFGAYGLSGVKSLNVASPDFVKAMDAVIASEEPAALQAYLRWHLVHAQARWLAAPFVEEDFNFYGRTLTGARELQARWKRCVRYTDRALGEALGQAYVEVAFSARGEAAHADHGAADRTGDGARHPAVELDERADQTAGAHQAAHGGQQGWISGQVARLHGAEDRARRRAGQRRAGKCV